MYCEKGVADAGGVFGLERLAVGPVVGRSARNTKKDPDLIPGEAREEADFVDGTGTGFVRHDQAARGFCSRAGVANKNIEVGGCRGDARTEPDSVAASQKRHEITHGRPG